MAHVLALPLLSRPSPDCLMSPGGAVTDLSAAQGTAAPERQFQKTFSATPHCWAQMCERGHEVRWPCRVGRPAGPCLLHPGQRGGGEGYLWLCKQ